MAVTLHCTAGPLAGELITVESELLLGREVSDVGRLGGDPRLSRRHARVFIDGDDRPVIEDLGSTNGTWVNGDRLEDPRVLVTGDEIRLGQTTFEVRPAEQPGVTKVRSADSSTRPVGDRGSVRPVLSIVAGPLRGAEIALPDELLVGRSYAEPGALGGDPRLSRRHARIARGPGGVFFIDDLGSTNGTLVNGAPLRGANALRNGDEITVGSSTLRTQGLPEAPLMDDLEEPPPEAPEAADEPSAAAPAPSLPAFEPQGAARARFSSRRLIVAFAGVFGLAAAAAAAVVLLAAPPGSRACPQGFVCHKPPTAPALRALATFRGSLGWRTEYDPQSATPITANVAGNQLTLRESNIQDRAWGANPGSGIIAIEFRAYSARKMSANAAMQSLLGSLDSQLIGATAAPSSDQIFANPVLGLHPAQGQAVEGNLRTAQGPGGLVKLVVLAASSGGVTVAAGVAYPVQQGQNQQNNPDQPLDTFADQILETVRFPSDGVV